MLVKITNLTVEMLPALMPVLSYLGTTQLDKTLQDLVDHGLVIRLEPCKVQAAKQLADQVWIPMGANVEFEQEMH